MPTRFLRSAFLVTAFSSALFAYLPGYSASADSQLATSQALNSANQWQRTVGQRGEFETRHLLNTDTDTTILSCLILNEESSAIHPATRQSLTVQPNTNPSVATRQTFQWAPPTFTEMACKIQPHEDEVSPN